MELLRATTEDAQKIMEIHGRSIRAVCPRSYTVDEVEAMANYQTKESSWARKIERDLVWVLQDSGLVQGFCHLAILDETEAEILGLYLSPEIIGRGLGRKLLAHVRAEAKLRDIRKISLLATLNAREFYAASGFSETEGFASILIGQKNIPCVAMEYEI